MNTKGLLQHEYAKTWQWRIDTDPELAASMGMLSRRRSSHALDPRSLNSFDQRLEWVEKALVRARDIDVTPLDERDSLTYRLYEDQLMKYISYTKKHRAYLCCVNRMEGPQTDLPLYANYLPVKTPEQQSFYKRFLEAVPNQLEEVQSLLRQGVNENRTPPKVSLSGVVEQIHKMADSGLTAFQQPLDKTNNEGGFLFQSDLREECLAIITEQIVPAFRAFASYLKNEYEPRLRTEHSASKGYPSGKEYYQDCLNFHTTTEMTPQQVHDMGLTEVARVRSDMEAIKHSDGFSDKPLEEYLEHLRTSPKFQPSSPEKLLAHYRNIIGSIYPKLLRLFHLETLPRQPLEVTETPSASANMAPAAYYLAGSTDTQTPRPGIFYVNTSELNSRRLYECEALALHEAIPGHHLQGAIQGEANIPDFLRFQEDRRYFEAPCRFPFYTGYIEGWGLHCETLGKELGLYNEATDRFGQLSMESIRACRLVVDTGMHALGWTQEEAVQYMLKNTAMGDHDARTEIARYCTWPGQACAYKVGERFIRRLRTLAETSLLDKFDPRQFYDVVLKSGAVPLLVLQDLVQQYIDSILETTTDVEANDKNSKSVERDSLDTMTFANWCKCCVIPGACQA